MRLCIEHQAALVELSPFSDVMRCPCGPHDLDLARDQWQTYDTEGGPLVVASGRRESVFCDMEELDVIGELHARRVVMKRRIVKGACWRPSRAARRSR